MAITPPWALQVGAPNCFNRPTAIGVATTVTADDTFLTFAALGGQVVNFQCHLHWDKHQQWWMRRRRPGGEPSLTEGSKNWRNPNEKIAW